MDSRSVSQPRTEQYGGSASPHIENAMKVESDHQTKDVATPVSNAESITGAGPQQTETEKAESATEHDGPEAASNETAVYGTRSRNRTSNARPNYAEDQDMDFEFVAPPTKPAPAKSASTSETRRNQQAATDSKRGIPDSSSARLNSANGSDQPEKSPSSGKDPIPGTSTFSTNPPKKRKAGGGTTTGTTSAGTSTPSAVASAQPSTKRQTAKSGYVPPANMSRESNMMTFEKSKGILKKGALVADDGSSLRIDDHVYLVCEPPGDPYYLCRIMEFLHTDSEDVKSPVDSIRVNWFYRPRDVQRHNSDSRLVYGTMHSDICPLTSLRGKCQIAHRSEIQNLDEFRKGKDCFWYSQIFDRFIRRFYELIPTAEIINVPDKVKKALDERWKYIAVEVGRVKELTSAVKLCKRCSQFCASNDSVDCAICHNSYHMNCVRPPLPKKPTRGFAWACGPCSRAQEKRLEARQTPLLGQSASATEEDEVYEEEEEDPAQLASTRAPSPSSEIVTDQHPGTQAEIAMAKMWPFRYLGIHCRVEDALQYDDRAIYPRASSRLGPRHQANINVWHGRPIELVKPAEIKKRYIKTGSHKKDGKLSKETIAAIEADRAEKAKRPKWVQDEPLGYVHRGEDYPTGDPRNTAQLLFKMPDEGKALSGSQDHSIAANEAFIDDYMRRAKGHAKTIRVAEWASNLQDKALQLLMEENYDAEKALQRLSKVDRAKDLKEPVLTVDELKKFEDGVAKFGSEHRAIRMHMKTTLPTSTIVRFYYLWKKTPRGKQIWDHYGGRKGKKRQNMDAAAKMQAEVADDVDDSAYDIDKAEAHKRGFQCKFCSTRQSRQWRRAPGVTPGQSVTAEGKGAKDKGSRFMLALCGRCAGLWRRYSIQYEDLDEATWKAAQNGGRGLKRRIDEELLREVIAAHETPSAGTPEAANVALPSIEGSTEPPKKKTKTAAEDKKKEKPAPPPKIPTPPPPPIVPDQPRWRELPCAVCKVLDASGELPVSCHHCKLTVHRRCYGLADQPMPSKWVCDQCANDRNPVVSTDYACTLCTVEETQQELLEPPRISHKKKTDREREKERLEKELTEQAKEDYRSRQKELNRPVLPREPLKRTDGNNWVHVLCAAWTPEIRFSQASRLERAEGLSAIPMERYEATCKLCKSNKHGSCVSCQQCKANFHVGCAAEAGYTFGFDVTPVKGSRKDQVTTVTLGEETGALAATIWCKEHAVKTVVHSISEAADDTGKNALQLYVESYKQADRTLTGTARKANLLSQSTKLLTHPVVPPVAPNRRVSTASNATRGARHSSAGLIRVEDNDGASPPNEMQSEASERRCARCDIDVSPKWWPVEYDVPVEALVPTADGDQDVRMSGVPDGMRQVNGGSIKEEQMNGDGPATEVQSHGGRGTLSQYHCHKCHWKNCQDPVPETEPKRPSLSPPNQIPTQLSWGPTMSENLAPPSNHFSHHHNTPAANGSNEAIPESRNAVHGVSAQPSQVVYQQANGFAPPLHAAQSNGSNGINGVSYSHPPSQTAQSQYSITRDQASPRPPPSQYAQVNGQPPPPPLPPSQYVPVNGQPSGPHHAQFPMAVSTLTQPSQQMANGIRSPQFPQASPAYMGAGGAAQGPQYPPSRTTESPFAAARQASTANGQHGSPPVNVARPVTPRDGSVDTRLASNTGASASPNLRNLLH